MSLCPIESLRTSVDETFVVVLEGGEPGCVYQLPLRAHGQLPRVPRAAPGCTPGVGLSWSFLTSPCWMNWFPQINLVAALQIASILGELPPNWCWFCGGACGLWVACKHAAGCGPSVIHRQLGCVEEASGGKVLVCKSAIRNPIPLGFCPGSRFYRSLLSCARLPRPRCRRQQEIGRAHV